mgnify:FL=1
MKLKYIISILAVVIVVIVVFSFRSQNPSQLVIDNNTGTNGDKTVSDTTIVKSTNPYVGTYEFKGEYQYNLSKNCVPRPRGDGTWIPASEAGWIPATLTVRVTFEAPPVNQYPVFSDNFDVIITKLWADDPDFGTGIDGVAPESGNGKPVKLELPWIPRSPENPASYALVPKSAFYPEGIALNKFSASYGASFNFPTGPKEWSTFVGFGGVNMGSEGFYISPDGKSMHNIPYVNLYGNSNTWGAHTQIGSGPLSGPYYPVGNKCGIDPRFVSWTFTKISD